MINLLNDNIVSSTENIDNTLDDETKQKIIEMQNDFNNRFYDIINNSYISKKNKDILIRELNGELLVKISAIIYGHNDINFYTLTKLILDGLYNASLVKKSE